MFQAPQNAEYNFNVAAAWFPYGDGWYGGWLNNASGINGGANNHLIGHPSLVLGTHVVDQGSGKTKVVYFRRACPKFDRQTFHEFARLSLVRCQWAQNYVNYYKAKGKKFHTIIRALAFKWIRILFRCWQDRTPYQDDKYLETLKKRGSIFATLHLEKTS